MQNMYAKIVLILPCLLALLAHVTVANNINSCASSYCADGNRPHTPSLQSILAHPDSAAVLLNATAERFKDTEFGNWTSSLLRHSTREGEGLPHVVEWLIDQVPNEVPRYRVSRPFIVGGVAWFMFLALETDGAGPEPGWDVRLWPAWQLHWDQKDSVNATLVVDIWGGGDGTRVLDSGKPVTFQGQDPLARTLGYIPGVAQAANCTCASVAGRGSDAHTTTCSQQGGTGSTTTRDRNHIVRVRFTHVVTSWAARDDGQAHIEASYHRACAEYLKTLQYVDLHGLRRQFDTVVRRRVQRNESVIYNEYEIGDATYDDKSRQRLVYYLAHKRVECHHGRRLPSFGKTNAVATMLYMKAGQPVHQQRYVNVLQGPTVEGGVRYLDARDGEDLARYDIECTAKDDDCTELNSNGSCTGAEAHGQWFEAFYDGLLDPTANDQEQHRERAKAVVDILKAKAAQDLQARRDWGPEWFKLRDAPHNRRALLPPPDQRSDDLQLPAPTGEACLRRLPPQGPQQQVLEWTICISAGPTHGAWTVPFVASGLIWYAMLTRTEEETRLELLPYVDFQHDVKAVTCSLDCAVTSGNLWTKGDITTTGEYPTIILWRIEGDGSRGQDRLSFRGLQSNIVIRLQLNATVDWFKDATSRDRAAHEAAYQQLLLLRTADLLNVGQRFRKTVRMKTTLFVHAHDDFYQVVLERGGRRYNLDEAHRLLDELMYDNLLCLTGSTEIANTKRAAVYDMALLRGARHVWNERAVYAPNTVLYHPDLDGADGCSSTGGAIGRGHSPASLARYLDVYGHEITSYYRECTADLEDLAYDIVFGEDEQREGSGEACRTGHDSLFSTANLARLSAGLTYCGVFVMALVALRVLLWIKTTLKRASDSSKDGEGRGQLRPGGSAVSSGEGAARSSKGGTSGEGHGSSGGKPSGKSREPQKPRKGGSGLGSDLGPGSRSRTANAVALHSDGPTAPGSRSAAGEGGTGAGSSNPRGAARPPAAGTPTRAAGAGASATLIATAQQQASTINTSKAPNGRRPSDEESAQGQRRVEAAMHQQETLETALVEQEQGVVPTAEAQAMDARGTFAGLHGAASEAHAAVDKAPPLTHIPAVGQAKVQHAAKDVEEDEAVCLVCHDGPRQWGFLHGGSVHVGVCGGCRELVRARAGAGGAVACPVCREQVDGIIQLIQA